MILFPRFEGEAGILFYSCVVVCLLSSSLWGICSFVNCAVLHIAWVKWIKYPLVAMPGNNFRKELWTAVSKFARALVRENWRQMPSVNFVFDTFVAP